MLRVAIIGYGKVGKIRRRELAARKDCKVLYVLDPSYERTYHLKGCTYLNINQVDQVLKRGVVDVAFICTPNFKTRDFVVQALNEGMHVFAEKPPGTSVSQVEDMIRAERSNPNLKLKFGFNHRYHDAVMDMKKRIDSGKWGNILWMRGRYGKSVDSDFLKSWRADKKLAGGGILMDQGIHMLDLFLHLCGPFEEVKGFVSNDYWKLDIEDNAFVIMRNARGQAASLHSTMTQWRHLFALEVFLERGYMVVNGFVTPSRTYGVESLTVAVNRSEVPRATHSMEEDIYYKKDESWRHEVEEFMSAIINDTPIRYGTSHDAWLVMNHIERIYADSGSLGQAGDLSKFQIA